MCVLSMVVLLSVTDSRADNLLGIQANGQLHGDTTFQPDIDGKLRFTLNVPEFEDHPFSRSALNINVPYRLNGRIKNHYLRVTSPGPVDIEIPLSEEVEAVTLLPSKIFPVRSIFEMTVTPILQYLLVAQWELFTQGALNNFAGGSLHEAMQGYALLDNSLRAAKDSSDYLEIYRGFDASQSHITVAIGLSGVLLLLGNDGIDTSHYTANMAQINFMYSALTGKLVDAADQNLITPLMDALYPANGSVRSDLSVLGSQVFRGPILSTGLLRGQSLTQDKPLYMASKLAIKSASETRMLNEMLGKKYDLLPGRMEEWGGNIAIAYLFGKDVPKGTIEQTLSNEFQQQMASHLHTQTVHNIHDFSHSLPSLIAEPWPALGIIIQNVIFDVIAGEVILKITMNLEPYLGGDGAVSRRIGKGMGCSIMLRSVGNGVIVPIMAAVADDLYTVFDTLYPNLSIKKLFQRDRVMTIHHTVLGEEQSSEEQSSGQPWRSSLVREEL